MSGLDKLKFWEKSKEEREDVSIIDEFKEPFSFQTFWEEQVVGRWLIIRQFLKEKGILFFLMSPFQYRNRLLVKLVLIVLGVFIGIVPRSMNLIDAARERNEGSQFANAQSALVSGSMRVEPLLASYYDDAHVLAFDLIGDTNDGVPSTTDGFNVDLSPSRGVSEAEHVRYQYRVLPVSRTNRLLLVYVDTSKQDNETGVYDLEVSIVHDEPMATPFEIILSDRQDASPIYDAEGIDLSALSGYLTGRDGEDTRIAEAEDALDNTLRVYQNNEERLQAMDMTMGFTTEDALSYVGRHLILNDLSDTSTTHTIAEMDIPTEPTLPEIVPTIIYNERTFRLDDELSESEAREYRNVLTELNELSRMVGDVQSNIESVNRARMQKFDELDSVVNTLNQNVSLDTFTEPQGIVEGVVDEPVDEEPDDEPVEDSTEDSADDIVE